MVSQSTIVRDFKSCRSDCWDAIMKKSLIRVSQIAWVRLLERFDLHEEKGEGKEGIKDIDFHLNKSSCRWVVCPTSYWNCVTVFAPPFVSLWNELYEHDFWEGTPSILLAILAISRLQFRRHRWAGNLREFFLMRVVWNFQNDIGNNMSEIL